MAAEAPTQPTTPERSLGKGREIEEGKRSYQPERKVSIKSPQAQIVHFLEMQGRHSRKLDVMNMYVATISFQRNLSSVYLNKTEVQD